MGSPISRSRALRAYRPIIEILDGVKTNNEQKVWNGNKLLLAYEQREVLQKVAYEKYPAISWWLSQWIQSPIPKDTVSFHDRVPTGRLGDFTDRWNWIENSMLPAWRRLTESSADREMLVALLLKMMQDGGKARRGH